MNYRHRDDRAMILRDIETVKNQLTRDKKTEEVLNRPHILGLTDKMPIGKYKGCTIDSLIEVEPKYLRWFKNTVTSFTLSDEVISQLSEPEQHGFYASDDEEDIWPDWGDIF